MRHYWLIIPYLIFLFTILTLFPTLVEPLPFDGWTHLLRAHEILHDGFNGLLWDSYTYADFGGRPVMYPPAYHLILAGYYATLGLWWANAAAVITEWFLLLTALMLLTRELFSDKAALIAGLSFFFLLPRLNVMWIPLPWAYCVAFSMLALLTYRKKNELGLILFLSLTLYTHYVGVFFYTGLLALTLLNKDFKKFSRAFLISALLFLPWVIHFLTYFWTYIDWSAYAPTLNLDFQYANVTMLILLSIAAFFSRKKHNATQLLIFYAISVLIPYLSLGLKDHWILISYVFLCVLAGQGFISLIHRGRKGITYLAGILAAGVLIHLIMGLAFYNYYTALTPYYADAKATLDVGMFSRMQTLAYYVQNITMPGETVFVRSNYAEVLAVLADRKVTGGQGIREWVPPAARTNTTDYQRVNLFMGPEAFGEADPEFYNPPASCKQIIPVRGDSGDVAVKICIR